MSSNSLPWLLACLIVFITSQRSPGTCVVRGVLVLWLSSMSRFFKPSANPFFCCRKGGGSCEDTHAFVAEYEDTRVNLIEPEDWPHTVTYSHNVQPVGRLKLRITKIFDWWWFDATKILNLLSTVIPHIVIKATMAADFVIKVSSVIAHQNTQAIKCRIKGRRIKGRTEAERTGHFSYSHFPSESNIFLLFYQQLQHTARYYRFTK